jgi:hypothetical protein
MLALLFGLVLSATAADKTFENSVLTFSYPDSASLNELDFDFMPEVSWKVLIDGKAALIGLQRDDETSQQQLLDRTKENITRQLDGASVSDLSTWGSLQRCKGITAKGRSKNPAYAGDVTVHAVTFTSGKKTVLLVAINPTSDARFAAVLNTARQSVKLKNN